MTVINRAVLDIETLTWDSVEREPYDGPWALADRAASNESKAAATTAQNLATKQGADAETQEGALQPFYRQEMNAQHGFTPGQTNELLNYAGEGTGGAAATSAGQIASTAARTRNTAGVSAALDDNARNRMQTMGGLNLGVGAQDIMGAKALNQEGAAGMQDLFRTNSGDQLKAMGLQNEDINSQINAGKSGWFQNTLAALNTIQGLGGTKMPKFGGGGGGTTTGGT